MMRVCAAGAFGIKHLDALSRIEGVTVTSVVGGGDDDIEGFARERGIGHATRDLSESLSRDDVDAVSLATPTQLHADQTIACLEAGKHVLCEIPIADSLEASQRVVEAQKSTGLVAMETLDRIER